MLKGDIGLDYRISTSPPKKLVINYKFFLYIHKYEMNFFIYKRKYKLLWQWNF